jgi:hypothetical protein
MRVIVDLPPTCGPKTPMGAFTLAEVVMSVFITMLIFAAIITAYVQTSYRAEWAGYSLVAQSAAIQQLEAAKAAVWDPARPQDEIKQLPPTTWVLLDLPVTSTNGIYATNYTTVSLFTYQVGTCIYSNYMVKVETAWPFRWKNQVVYFTNTIAGYYAPD